MTDVLAEIGQDEAAIGKTQHAGVVGRLSGEQSGAAGRTSGRCAVSAAKQDALLGEAL